MTQDVLSLDFETYAELPIKVGTYRYMKHRATEVMMSAYAMNGGKVSHEDHTERPYLSKYLDEALRDPEVLIRAYNAPFERRAIIDKLGIYVPPERFRCTMVEAWSLSFAGSMGEVGAQIGVDPELLKMERGSYYINKFCKPAPKNHKAIRYTKSNSPEDWAGFCGYNVQDVYAEMAIADAIAEYSFTEDRWQEWFLDQRINDRGLPVDMDSVNGAILIASDEKKRLMAELIEITQLANPNSAPQLQGWLGAQGLPLPNMQAETIRKALKKKMPPHIENVLKLKQMLAKTSVSKYAAVQNSVIENGDEMTLNGTFQFGGAQRTGRWAGRIFQPHNISRPTMDEPEAVAGILATGNAELVEMLHGPIMPFLSNCTRSMIKAPKGKRVGVSDLASIESRMLAWNSGCERLNQLYVDDRDGYLDFGSEFYRIPYADVTPKQRKYMKPTTLGCGFGLGAVGLVKYADSMGVDMSEDDAKRAVKVFRNMYPEIPKMWYWLVDKCTDCIETWTEHKGYGVKIHRDDHFMFITLPSGRAIAYYQPAILMLKPPWKGDPEPRPTITYMGRHDKTRKWVRQSTHGGKITENICQAEARDVLMFDMQLMDKDPELDVRGHVHDEIIALIDENIADEMVKVMEAYMSTSPDYMPGLVLGAEGFHASRYTKR